MGVISLVGEPVLLAQLLTLQLGPMTDRSYPGFLDWCWPDNLNIRRLQLGVSAKCWRLSVHLTTWQHWCRCPELSLQLGLVRFHLLLPAGLLPNWAPRINWAWFPA